MARQRRGSGGRFLTRRKHQRDAEGFRKQHTAEEPIPSNQGEEDVGKRNADENLPQAKMPTWFCCWAEHGSNQRGLRRKRIYQTKAGKVTQANEVFGVNCGYT